jgi:hypothetical protein
MSKLKVIVVAALIAALAAVGAGWKWNKGVRRSVGVEKTHLIAGWSWGGSKDSKRGDRDSQQ